MLIQTPLWTQAGTVGDALSEYRQSMEQHQLSNEDLLALHPLDVCELLNVTQAKAQELIMRVAMEAAPACTSALDLLQVCLTTSFDLKLNFGIHRWFG